MDRIYSNVICLTLLYAVAVCAFIAYSGGQDGLAKAGFLLGVNLFTGLLTCCGVLARSVGRRNGRALFSPTLLVVSGAALCIAYFTVTSISVAVFMDSVVEGIVMAAAGAMIGILLALLEPTPDTDVQELVESAAAPEGDDD